MILDALDFDFYMFFTVVALKFTTFLAVNESSNATSQ